MTRLHERLKAEDCGHLIWDALASGTHLTSKQLILLTGLSESQFHNGLAWIKDVFQGDQEQPICYDPRTHQYSLAEQWPEVRDYTNWSLKGLVTRARRVSSTLAAAADKFPTSPAARRVKRDALRLVDDLKDMREEILDSHADAG